MSNCHKRTGREGYGSFPLLGRAHRVEGRGVVITTSQVKISSCHFRFSLRPIKCTFNHSTFLTTITMDSPPPTPKSPKSSKQRRFARTGAVCEWVEEYHPGGYHPVNLGDTFRDGKYRVIRKLGYGSYSTVWLAVSTGYVLTTSCSFNSPSIPGNPLPFLGKGRR